MEMVEPRWSAPRWLYLVSFKQSAVQGGVSIQANPACALFEVLEHFASAYWNSRGLLLVPVTPDTHQRLHMNRNKRPACRRGTLYFHILSRLQMYELLSIYFLLLVCFALHRWTTVQLLLLEHTWDQLLFSSPPVFSVCPVCTIAFYKQCIIELDRDSGSMLTVGLFFVSFSTI